MLCFTLLADPTENKIEKDRESLKPARVYWLRKCSGSGCPYAASWLAHINLFKKVNNKKQVFSFKLGLY